MENKLKISPTQIGLYTKCGEAYRRRYIKKEVIPPGFALIKGISVHKGSEENFKQKISTREDLPSKQIIEISVDTFEGTIKNEGLLLSKEEELIGKKKLIGEQKDKVVMLSEMYSKNIAPKYYPTEVEEFNEIEIDPHTSLLGRIDLIDENENIIDLKTGTKTKNQNDIDKDVQFTFYSLVYESIKKKAPKSIIIEQMVDKKTPEVVTFNTTRNHDDYSVLINRINSVIDGIRKEVYIPAQPDSWMCSEKFCGYAKTCPFFTKQS